MCRLMKLLTTFLRCGGHPQSFLALRGVRCAGRAESQIPLAHESNFRSRTWRMVRQHRQSLGDRTISDADRSLRFDPGNLNLSFRGSLQRPDGNGNVANAATGSMFNIAAFNPIPEGPVGNCGVGILEGPGTATIAAGLSKTFHLTERMRMRLEGTFTNLFNHPNFALPPTNVTSSSFGIVQSVQSAETSGNRTGRVSLRLDS